MKLTRRLLTLALAVMLLLSLGMTAYADTYATGANMLINPTSDSIARGSISTDSADIVVSKTFVNLPAELVPENFQISLSPTGGTLTKENASISTDGLTWTWKVPGLTAGTYTVSESNETVDGYAVSANIPDNGQFTIQAGSFTVTPTVVEKCSNQYFNYGVNGGENHVFAVAAKDKVIFISEIELTESQKLTLIKSISGLTSDWKEEYGNNEFFILTGEKGTYTYGEDGDVVKIDYDPERAGQELYIQATKMWTKVATLTYNLEAASGPDIGITNTYEALTTSINVDKTWVGDDNGYPKDRPDSITVNLFQKLETDASYPETPYRTATIAPDENGQWAYTFPDLPLKNDDGVDYVYDYLTENTVPGYKTDAITSTVDEDGIKTFHITNRIDDPSVTITKQVTGNMGDVNKAFAIQIDVFDNSGFILNPDTNEWVTSYTVNLKSGQSSNFTVTDGTKLQVTEPDNDSYDMKVFTTWVSHGSNENVNYSSSTPITNNISITVENNHEVLVDTGIFLDSLPYVLILAVVAVGGVVFLRKRRERDED